MRTRIIIIFFISSLNVNVIAQQVNYSGSIFFQNQVINNLTLLVIPSPTVIVENRKVYFGLSKEVSLGFGKYAEHRLAFEYSYVFRDSVNNHYRFSYNYDMYPSSIINFSIGGGYFTDTYKNGFFPQLSIAAIGTGDKIYFTVYIKSRVTFALQKNNTGLFDLSAGFSVGLAPFGSKVRKGFDY